MNPKEQLGQEPRGSVEYGERVAPMDREFPGTALSSKDLKSGKILSWEDRFAARYAWDCGLAVGAYLEGLREGVLWATVCGGCRRVMVPPRTFCELCWRPVRRWRTLPGSGRVNTFSLCYVNWDATRRQDPLIPAVVELDGASPQMGILHLLGEVDPLQVEMGMAVEAVWRPEEERQGAITDILHFRPRRGGGRKRGKAGKGRRTGEGRGTGKGRRAAKGGSKTREDGR